ncbi:MAG TPA: hypothetical protein PKN63_12115 [Chitinophagales bacterium]|nr:hypothetical protein [Chitinophagales bacterium]
MKRGDKNRDIAKKLKGKPKNGHYWVQDGYSMRKDDKLCNKCGSRRKNSNGITSYTLSNGDVVFESPECKTIEY